MFGFGKLLPGEAEGKLDPQEFGFGVIPIEPISEAEEERLIVEAHQRVYDLTGVVIPRLGTEGLRLASEK